MEERLVSRFRLGALRRRAAARPGDPDRDPAAEGASATTSTSPTTSSSSSPEVRPERPRARGCARPGRRVVRAHGASDRRPRSPSRRSQDLLPQTETEIPPQLILEETRHATSACRPTTSSRPNRSRPLTHGTPHRDVPDARVHAASRLVKIGEIFGGRDHTTARHGINKIERDMRARTPPTGRCRTSRGSSGAGPGAPEEPGGHRRGSGGAIGERRGPHGEGIAPILPTPSPCRRARYAGKQGWLVHFSTGPTTTVEYQEDKKQLRGWIR